MVLLALAMSQLCHTSGVEALVVTQMCHKSDVEALVVLQMCHQRGVASSGTVPNVSHKSGVAGSGTVPNVSHKLPCSLHIPVEKKLYFTYKPVWLTAQ